MNMHKIIKLSYDPNIIEEIYVYIKIAKQLKLDTILSSQLICILTLETLS